MPIPCQFHTNAKALIILLTVNDIHVTSSPIANQFSLTRKYLSMNQPKEKLHKNTITIKRQFLKPNAESRWRICAPPILNLLPNLQIYSHTYTRRYKKGKDQFTPPSPRHQALFLPLFSLWCSCRSCLQAAAWPQMASSAVFVGADWVVVLSRITL